MARVLLAQPPWYVLQNIRSETLSLGLGYIAAVLTKQGHEVAIFNGEPPGEDSLGSEGIVVDLDYYKKMHELGHPVWRRFEKALGSFRPDLLGISIWTGAYHSAQNIVSIAKKFNPQLSVIAGGIHPTLLPTETLEENPGVDYVICGEGEETILQLVSAIVAKAGIEDISGIYFRKNGSIIHTPPRPYIENLDSLLFPDFSSVVDGEFYSPDAFSGIITSRGCPYSCIYCASHLLWGKKVRFRSPENVVDEIIQRINFYQVKNLRFHDDSFALDKERALRISDLIIEKGLKINWQCDTRADLIDETLLQKMKLAGCRQINIGVESGSKRILESIGKNISLQQIRNAVRMIKSAKINIAMYFMAGFPGETADDIRATISLMKELKPNRPIWSLVTPYPGSEIYEFSRQRGLLPEDKNWTLYFHHSAKMRLAKAIDEQEWLALIDEINKAASRIVNRAGIIVNIRRILGGLRGKISKNVTFAAIYLKFLPFIYFNKGSRKNIIPKVHFGNITLHSSTFVNAANLRIKKLQRYFINYKKGFNLIYTNGYEPDYEICRLAKKFKIPVVMNLNGLYYRAWYGPGWERQNIPFKQAYGLADYAIFQSQFAKLSAEALLGPVRSKWDVVYNAVDTKHFTPGTGALDESTLIILVSGNNITFSRVEVPVRTLKLLIQRGVKVKLIIAGYLNSGLGQFNVEGRIQRLVHELVLDSAVKFIPSFSQSESPDIFRSAHILLHAQYNDVCPTTVIEAMACGLPVVYSHSGGTPELVGPDAGIGIPVKLDWDNYQALNPESAASAVMEIAKNREKMAIAARKRAVQYFDIEQWIEKHRQIFISLLK